MSMSALAREARRGAHSARAHARVLSARAGTAKTRASASRAARAARPPADRTDARDVFALSFPLFIELFMQIMIGNVNQFMLAPHGAESAAAVGNALQILNIVTIALSAMGTASTVLVTRVLGSPSSKGSVSEIAAVALVVNVVLSAAMTAALFAFWPQFFAWLHIGEPLQGMASSFLLIVGSTTVLQGAFFAFTALLRSYARAADVMKASLAMNAVNIAASAVLVGGAGIVPSLGVEGAALANVLARIVGLGFAIRLVSRNTDVRMRLSHVRPFPWRTLRRMLGVGVPSSGEQMNYDLAQIVILSFINVLGTTVVTVKVYCSMIAGIAYLYSIALSQATQIVLGYLFGAGKFDAVARRVWVADLIAIALTTAVSTTIWLNAGAVFGVFTADPLVHELGRQVLFVEIFLGIGRALNIVMVRALIAVGDVKTPVTVNVVSSWAFAVGGGYLLGIGLGWGIVGMWVAMCADEWLRAAFLIATFARGGWRRRAIEVRATEAGIPAVGGRSKDACVEKARPESERQASGCAACDPALRNPVAHGGIEPAPAACEPDSACAEPRDGRIPSTAFATLPLGSRRPNEPAEPGLAAIAALALADDGGLARTVVHAVKDAMTLLW